MPKQTAEEFALGVEEEYQIVDPISRALCSRALRVLPCVDGDLGEVQPELLLSQIESATPVCRTLADVRAEVARLRREVIAAAEQNGNRIAAAGTHPFSHWEEQRVTPKTRYKGLADDYRQLADELVIFGCHVHVSLADREAAIDVMNRSRIWLAPLLALTANSPFWLGRDTGYASYRTELWARFPISGPPGIFRSRAEYESLVQALVATGSIKDATKIYWDIRLPERIETIEFRVTDVSTRIEEAVMVAGLARALVETCYEQGLRGEPSPEARPELLRAAHWRAARHGVEGDLIDVRAERSVPAREMIETLLAFVRASLEERGEWDEIASGVREVLEGGTGARRQREAYERRRSLEDVVDFVVAETAKGVAQ